MSAPRTCECMSCSTCYAREWARKRYRLRAYGQWDPHADLQAVRDHLIALRNDGIGIKAIAIASGVGRSQVERISNGRTQRIGQETAAKLLAVTDEARVQIPGWRVTRRLQALNAIGYSTRHLAELMGTNQDLISDHLAGHRKWVQLRTFEKASEVYERLCMTPGGNKASTRIAKSRGYLPPLAWDDIDNPNESYVDTKINIDPVVIDRILAGDMTLAKTATKAEKAAVVTRWRAEGRSLNELDRLSGWQSRRYLEGEAA